MLELPFRHAHHLCGEAVCFPFVLVSRLTAPQLRLHRSYCRRAYGHLAKIVFEARWCRSGQSDIGFFSLSLQHP